MLEASADPRRRSPGRQKLPLTPTSNRPKGQGRRGPGGVSSADVGHGGVRPYRDEEVWWSGREGTGASRLLEVSRHV